MGAISKAKRQRDQLHKPDFALTADPTEAQNVEAGGDGTSLTAPKTGHRFGQVSVSPRSPERLQSPRSDDPTASSLDLASSEREEAPARDGMPGMVAPAIVNDVLRSSGQPLSSSAREFLEPRFGHDFSQVSVHSDAKAAESARAVNANAYTVGRHVVFREGRYDAGTPAGQRLLAHELTHVVQQQDQQDTVPHALRVGKVGDPFEQEAARVAGSLDGHASAHPISVRAQSSSGAVAAGVVQRDAAEDLEEMAEAGGQQAVEDAKHNVNQPPVMRVSNINSVDAAKALVAQIEGWRGNMQEGAGATGAFKVSPGRVTPEKMAANETAISKLDDYLVTAGEQSRTLGSFQDALQKAHTNYERLKAQVTHLLVTKSIEGGTAGEMGQQITQAAGFEDPEAAQARMKRLEANPALAGLHNQLQIAHDQMKTLGQQAGDKQSAVNQTAYKYDEELNAFKTGIPTVNDNPEQAKELNELKEKIENVKKYVGKGLEYAGKGLEKAGVKGAETVAAHAGPVVDWLTDEYFNSELNSIQTKIEQYNTVHKEHAIDSKLDAVRAASRAFTAAITDFSNTVEAFNHAQATFRDQLEQFGRAAGSGGGKNYAEIAAVLAEVDTYEQQLDEALRLAYQEQTAAREAASSRKTLEGGPNTEGGRDAGLPYYEPYKFFHSNGGWGYQCQRHELHLAEYWTNKGSVEGDISLNATVDQAVESLQGFRSEIDPMRQALAKAMDLRMDEAMPTPVGGPGPTAASANTGL